MSRIARWITGTLAAAALVFGLLCLNYTKADGVEHHRKVAAERGWPPPSPTIFYGGAASTSLGAGALGFVLGRRVAAKRT